MSVPDQIVELLKNNPNKISKLENLFLLLPYQYDLNYTQFQLKNNNIEIIKKCIYLYIKNNKKNILYYLILYGFYHEIYIEIFKKENIKNINCKLFLFFINYYGITQQQIYPYLNPYKKLIFQGELLFYSIYI